MENIIKENCTYKKEFQKRYITVNRDYDSSFAYDILVEDLWNRLDEIKDNIYCIENSNTRNFTNIFAYKWEKEYGNTYIDMNYYTIEFDNWEVNIIDVYEENTWKTYEEIVDEWEKYFEDTIWYVWISCRWYSQWDWDEYYIYYNKNKITEQEIKEQFKWIKYLFTTEELYIKDTDEYLITITDSEWNIIESRIETEDEYTWWTINWDESYSEIEEQISKEYPEVEIIFNLY